MPCSCSAFIGSVRTSFLSSVVIVADAFIPCFISSSFGIVISTVYFATPPFTLAVLPIFVTSPSNSLFSIASNVTTAACPSSTELISSSSTLTDRHIFSFGEIVNAVTSVLYWLDSVFELLSEESAVSELCCVEALPAPEAVDCPVPPVFPFAVFPALFWLFPEF